MRATSIFAALALATALMPGGAWAQEKLTLNTIEDPAYESAIWALMNGKVSDPSVSIAVTLSPIPRNAANTMAQAFNITSTGITFVPQLAEQGIKTKIFASAYKYNPNGHPLDIWVMKDSPYQTITDLKGKTIATQSLENQGTTSIRAIMSLKYGLNPATVGGDMRWVELPNPQLEPALQAGRIDAALIATVPAYNAVKRNAYRSVLQGSKELEALYGGAMPTTVFVGYEADMERRPAAYETAAKLLKASSEYMQAHQAEVFAAVAPKYKMSVEDMTEWFNTYATMPFSMSETDKKIYMKAWEASNKMGGLAKVPASVDEFIWSKAVVSP